MRKFCVRWWVLNPKERYEREIEALSGYGVSLRYRREATAEEVRFHVEVIRFLDGRDLADKTDFVN